MSSSISSSEPHAAAAGWRHWLAVFCAVLGGCGGLAYAFLLLVDPYDTGRFPSLGISGFRDESPRTANVSRGRDPRFDAAIIGSSTGQLLDPTRLSQASGPSFVQLTIAGTGPREQLAVLDWFISHHRRIGALVIAPDFSWCGQDPVPTLEHPFPFWLYGSDRAYLANLLRPHSFELALRRIAVALRLSDPTDSVGFKDYEAGRAWAFKASPVEEGGAPEAAPLPESLPALPFPSIERLAQTLAHVADGVPVVLVMPPVFAALLPRTGTPSAARLAQCKQALARAAAARPAGAFLDFRVWDALTRDPKNFMDPLHYRRNVARQMEDAIATSIRSAVAGSAQLTDKRMP